MKPAGKSRSPAKQKYPEEVYIQAATASLWDLKPGRHTMHAVKNPADLVKTGESMEVALYRFVGMVKISDKVYVEKVT